MPAPPVAAVQSWWRPQPGRLSFNYVLQGAVSSPLSTDVVIVDLFDTSQAAIKSLTDNGRQVICYFSAGSLEAWRSDAASFPASVRGNPLDGWPDEVYVDVTSTTVRSLMQARIALAASKKCQCLCCARLLSSVAASPHAQPPRPTGLAVDADNVDSYSATTGFKTTQAQSIAYVQFLATEAHKLGLAFGLKNALEIVPSVIKSVDFAVIEQSWAYAEVASLKPYVVAGKAVFDVEYGQVLSAFCPSMNAAGISAIQKDQNDMMELPLSQCAALYSAPCAPAVSTTLAFDESADLGGGGGSGSSTATTILIAVLVPVVVAAAVAVVVAITVIRTRAKRARGASSHAKQQQVGALTESLLENGDAHDEIELAEAAA